MNNFSFDEWAELFQKDPAEFELRRADLLERTIQASPVQHRARLRLLQVECDGIRQAMPPLEAAAEMSKMAVACLQHLKTPLTQLRSSLENITNPE